MKKEMIIEDMTRKDFDKVPHKDSFKKDIGDFDSLIILPLRAKHDSGFRCMDFVAAKKNKPICRLSGCSDIVHLNGIGGYGYNWLEKYNAVPNKVDTIAWNIDCLPKSGLLRLFTWKKKLIAGDALSSFEIYEGK